MKPVRLSKSTCEIDLKPFGQTNLKFCFFSLFFFYFYNFCRALLGFLNGFSLFACVCVCGLDKDFCKKWFLNLHFEVGRLGLAGVVPEAFVLDADDPDSRRRWLISSSANLRHSSSRSFSFFFSLWKLARKFASENDLKPTSETSLKPIPKTGYRNDFPNQFLESVSQPTCETSLRAFQTNWW